MTQKERSTAFVEESAPVTMIAADGSVTTILYTAKRARDITANVGSHLSPLDGQNGIRDKRDGIHFPQYSSRRF